MNDGLHMRQLVLLDGRLPCGGHVHSFGVESAVADGRISDLDQLAAFVRGRIRTSGLTEAALVSCACRRLGAAGNGDPGVVLPPFDRWLAAVERIDTEANARLPVEPLREASRKLGRQLMRVAQRCWPCSTVELVSERYPGGLHQSVALGIVAQAAGATPLQAARISLHHSISAPIQAAIRLLGLDPFAAAALTVQLADIAELTAKEAAFAGEGPLSELPSRTGMVTDLAAIEHPNSNPRMFAT